MRQVALEPSRTPRRRLDRAPRVRQPPCRVPRTPAPGRRPAHKRLRELCCTCNFHPFIRVADVTGFVQSTPGRRSEPPRPERSPACRFDAAPPPHPGIPQGQESIGAALRPPRLQSMQGKIHPALQVADGASVRSNRVVGWDRRRHPSGSADGKHPIYRSGSDGSEREGAHSLCHRIPVASERAGTASLGPRAARRPRRDCRSIAIRPGSGCGRGVG